MEYKSFVLLGLCCFFILFSSNVHAEWWNSSWSVRQPIIVNTSVATYNYQVLLNVTYESEMNANFSDLRFVNLSNNAKLDYWIQNKVDSSYADVWIEMDNIKTSNGTQAYVYYGNNDALSESNITNTMIFGDDFYRLDSDPIDGGWEGDSGSGIIINDTKLMYKTGTITITHSVADHTGDNISINLRYMCEDVSNCDGRLKFQDGGTDVLNIDMEPLDPCEWQNDGSGGTTMHVLSSNVWYEYELQVDYLNEIFDWFTDGTETHSNEAFQDSETDFIDTVSWGINAHVQWWDWVFIRKFMSQEPTYSFGAEEGLPPNITISSPTNTTYTDVTSIDLNVTIDVPVDWCGYELDGESNVSMTVTGNVCQNTTITGLSSSQHSIILWANNTYGDMSNSTNISFTMFNSPPSIINFTLNNTYLLINETVRINVTVSDKDGIDSVYANVTYPNGSSEIVVMSKVPWAYSRDIDCSNMVNYPGIINSSVGFTVNDTKQFVWILPKESTPILKYNDSGNYAIYNSTDYQMPMDVESGNESSISPTSVWDADTVYHLFNLSDTMGNYTLSINNDVSFTGNGYFYNASLFPNTFPYGDFLFNSWATVPSEYSFSVWANLNDTTESQPFTFITNDTGSDGGIIFFAVGNQLYFDVHNVDIWETYYNATTMTGEYGHWIHLGLSWNGTNIVLYKNGTIVLNTTTVQPSGSTEYGDIHWYGDMANASTDQSLEGILDEIREYTTTKDTAYFNNTYHNGVGTSGFCTLGSENVHYTGVFSSTKINGVYNVTIFVNDTLGAINSTKTNFTVNETGFPEVNITISQETYNQLDSVNIITNITSSLNISYAYLNVTKPDSTTNKTILYYGAGSTGVHNLTVWTDTSQIGTYTVSAWANNTNNRIDIGVDSFYVNDTFAPKVENLSTNVSTLNQENGILMFVNIVDDPMSFLDWILFEVAYPNGTLKNNTVYTRSQNSLISQWSFDNASAGDNFNSNHGTIDGATYNATGGYNGKGCYMFDGNNDDIDMGNGSTLNPTNMSISVWILKTAIGGDQVAVGKRVGSNPGYVMHYFSNKFNFEIDTDTPSYLAIGDTSDITPNTWINYIGTYNGTKATLYKNGKFVDSGDINGSISNSNIFYVGRRDAGSYWNGSIDGIRLYNSSFNASQVAELYDQEKNNRFNLSFLDTLLIGSYTVTIFSNDTPGGNMNNTETISFSVNDSRVPNVSSISVNSSSINISDIISISAIISEDPMSFLDTILFEFTHPNWTLYNYTVYKRSQNSLISQWSFDNASANDDFGSNDGTVSGATYNASGGHNGKGAYEFDGDGDSITVTDSNSLHLTEDVTISAWFKLRNSADSFDIIKKHTYDHSPYAFYKRSDGRIEGIFSNNTTWTAGTDQYTGNYLSWNANQWYFLAVTFDGSENKACLYRDGIADTCVDKSGSKELNASTNTLWIASNGYGGSSNGTIDSVRIYNSTLNASQVAELYDQEKNNRFNLSFSDTSQLGDFSIRVYANDTLDNVNGTENLDFQVRESEIPSANISVNVSTINQSKSILILSNIVDALSFIDTVIYTITYPNGISQNNTVYTISQNSLVSQWFFDNTFANDNFGSNDGIIDGATYNATGGHNGKGCYMFDGNDSIIFSIDPFNSIKDKISISYWIKPAGAGVAYQYVLYKRAGEYIRIKYRESDNKVYSSFTTGDGASTYVYSDTLTPNTWYNVILTYDKDGGSDNIRLYLNGVIDDTQTHTGQILEGENLSISSTSNGFNGSIDDVRIYNYTLNDSQVAELYDQQKNNRFNLSFSDTNLIGNHQVFLYVNDTWNNINNSESTEFLVNDSEPPLVENLSTNQTLISLFDTIGIYANIVDDPMSFLDTILYEITYPNGTSKNNTVYKRSQNSLISQWSFDNASANDNFGSNDGTVYGATYNSTGGHNGKGAYMFDGINDYIDVGNNSSLNPSNITIIAWAYFKSFNPGGNILTAPVSKGGMPGDGWEMRIRDLKDIYFKMKIGGVEETLDGPSDLTENTWYFFAMTYNGSDFIAYRDGVQVDSEPASGSIDYGTSNILIGRLGSAYLNGSIDNVRIFGEAFTASEILALYDQDKNNRFNLSFSDTSQEGVYGILVYANDSSNNINGTVSSSFFVGEKEIIVYNNGTSTGSWNLNETVRAKAECWYLGNLTNCSCKARVIGETNFTNMTYDGSHWHLGDLWNIPSNTSIGTYYTEVNCTYPDNSSDVANVSFNVSTNLTVSITNLQSSYSAGSNVAFDVSVYYISGNPYLKENNTTVTLSGVGSGTFNYTNKTDNLFYFSVGTFSSGTLSILAETNESLYSLYGSSTASTVIQPPAVQPVGGGVGIYVNFKINPRTIDVKRDINVPRYLVIEGGTCNDEYVVSNTGTKDIKVGMDILGWIYNTINSKILLNVTPEKQDLLIGQNGTLHICAGWLPSSSAYYEAIILAETFGKSEEIRVRIVPPGTVLIKGIPVDETLSQGIPIEEIEIMLEDTNISEINLLKQISSKSQEKNMATSSLYFVLMGIGVIMLTISLSRIKRIPVHYE